MPARLLRYKGAMRILAWSLAVVALLAAAPSGAVAAKKKTRPVLVVANNWDGTADVVDPRRYTRLKRLNIVPDIEQRMAEIRSDPVAYGYFLGIRQLVGEGTTSTSTTPSPPRTAGSCSSRGRASPTWWRSACATAASSGA